MAKSTTVAGHTFLSSNGIAHESWHLQEPRNVGRIGDNIAAVVGNLGKELDVDLYQFLLAAATGGDDVLCIVDEGCYPMLFQLETLTKAQIQYMNAQSVQYLSTYLQARANESLLKPLTPK